MQVVNAVFSIIRITGFKGLTKEEQEELLEKLGSGAKKRKAGGDAGGKAKKMKSSVKESEEEKTLRVPNNSRFVYYCIDLGAKRCSLEVPRSPQPGSFQSSAASSA